MNLIKITGLLMLLTFVMKTPCLAQEIERIPQTADIQAMIEELAEDYEAELDYTDLIESLTRLAQHPLNLNEANREDIQQLPFLNDIQVSNLLDYREEYGEMLSIYELTLITGFNQQFLEKIRYFITFEPVSTTPPLTLQNATKYGRSDLFLRYQRILEQQTGFINMSDSAFSENPGRQYLGDPGKYYLRYSYDYFDKISFDLVAEKDPGEYFSGRFPAFADSLKPASGFDFYSGNISVSDLGPVSQITVGDYNLEFGQGLTLWSGLSFGKSASRINMKNFARKIKPSTSANENLFMRGITATADYNKFSLTGFYSNQKIDANIQTVDSVSGDILSVTSLQTSGYHRTVNELADKDVVKQEIIGGNIAYSVRRFRINFTSYQSSIGASRTGDSQLYRKFLNTDDKRLHYGLSAEYIWKNISFFSEIASENEFHPAFIGGLYAYLHPQFEASIVYRNYPRSFDNPFSNAFGENTRNNNEEGIYLGIKSALHKNWTLTAWADHFRFPWLKYRTDAPSTGREYAVQLDYHPSRYVDAYIRYRFEDKLENTSMETIIDYPVERIKQSVRGNLEYSLSKSFSLKHRFEYAFYEKDGDEQSKGYLLLSDAIYRPENKPFDLSLRYALFDTDDYNSRLYAYEHDVLYAFSIPSYYYKGSRIYLLLKYELNRHISLWARYTQTFYTNQHEIGSGLNLIDGNRKSEIKAQVRIRL